RTVTPVNDPPVARSDVFSTDEDTALTVAAPGVLGNDTDVDSAVLVAILVTGPAHGTLAFRADGGFQYVPAADFNGTDGFSYSVGDGAATSNTATVTIDVAAVDDAPVAQSQAAVMDERTVLQGRL